jgi:hypothetical protein
MYEFECLRKEMGYGQESLMGMMSHSQKDHGWPRKHDCHDGAGQEKMESHSKCLLVSSGQ